jgi:hypothetical protein
MKPVAAIATIVPDCHPNGRPWAGVRWWSRCGRRIRMYYTSEDHFGPDQKLRPYNASTAKTPYNGRTHYAPYTMPGMIETLASLRTYIARTKNGEPPWTLGARSRAETHAGPEGPAKPGPKPETLQCNLQATRPCPDLKPKTVGAVTRSWAGPNAKTLQCQDLDQNEAGLKLDHARTKHGEPLWVAP